MYSEITPMGFGITIETKGVLFSEQSRFQKVEILDSDAFGKILTLDGLMMTTEKDEFFYHEMISHIPLISHKNPENVLVIGGGDGGTVREVLKHDCVKKVDLCEIDEMVIEASEQFLPTIAGKLREDRVQIFVEDAIEFIKRKKNEYDVILIDSTDPMGPGEGLFTEEFYTNIKEALREGGIMCAQSESPIVNKAEIQKIYPLLRKVFNVVEPFCGPIPTYPGGYWSWSFCSQSVKPLEFVDVERAKHIEEDAKVYNEYLHFGAFAVPNFMRELCK